MPFALHILKKHIKNLVLGDKGLIAGALCLAALMLAIIWFGTFKRMDNEKALTLENALSDSKNIASIVAANLNEVLDRANLYARKGRDIQENDLSYGTNLRALISGDPAYLRAALFDAKGSLLQSSANRRSEPELAHLLAIAQTQSSDGAQVDQLITGRPSIGTNASWRVPILIPFSSPKGDGGYFAAIIDLGYFLRLYRDVNLGESGRIEIVTRSGYQLAEMNGVSLSGGFDYAGTDYAAFLHEPATEGVMKKPHPGTTKNEIGVFRILQQYPFAIVVTRSEENLLARLSARRSDYLMRATAVSAVVIFLVFGLFVIAYRQRRLYNVLASSEQEKLELIVQLEQEKSRALRQASHDHLTGIPNRMLFYELASAELARAKRSRRHYALLFLDLDKFKLINDTLGHATGDLLLQSVSSRLRESLREYDLLARLGGDEFVILVSEMMSENDISKLAAKLVDVVRLPFHDLNGYDVEVSPSIGIALYPRDGQNLETLLTHADSAMYQAKAAGAGTHRFFDTSLNASSARDAELLARFKRAIKENEFCLYYQPKARLSDYKACGLEALIRWRHPEHGLIYPNDFIALAEANDLIVPLGSWVIDAACRQLDAWRTAGLPLLPIAVNVSPKQLRDDALIHLVTSALATYHITADLLEIEVTEGCFIEDVETTNRVLEQLRDLGVRISLDDYGTGFSSLKNLTKLPIHAIKIDRSFIRDIRNDTSDAVIVSSTITLAHNLGLEVIAEGVESREQVMHLKTAGCDYVQGFYFQRPVPASEIVAVLKRGSFDPL